MILCVHAVRPPFQQVVSGNKHMQICSRRTRLSGPRAHPRPGRSVAWTVGPWHRLLIAIVSRQGKGGDHGPLRPVKAWSTPAEIGYPIQPRPGDPKTYLSVALPMLCAHWAGPCWINVSFRLEPGERPQQRHHAAQGPRQLQASACFCRCSPRQIDIIVSCCDSTRNPRSLRVGRPRPHLKFVVCVNVDELRSAPMFAWARLEYVTAAKP